MSDNEEYYNDNNSDSDSSSDVDVPISKNKNVAPFKPKVSGVLSIKDYDDDDDDEISDDEIVDVDADDDVVDEVVDEVEDIDDGDDDIDFDDEDDEQEGGDDPEGEQIDNENKKKSKSTKQKEKQVKPKTTINPDDIDDEDDDADEDDDQNYLQKFDSEISKSYVSVYHPECMSHNYDEIAKLSQVIKDKNGIIIDPFHKTIPFLTKYEKTRILGQRAKQIENGAKPFVKIPENIIDSYIIAELELQQKRIPFIIRRPLPCGGCEYWNLKDLENIEF